MKCVLRLLVFAALATLCIADSIVYVRVHRPLIEEHLKLTQEGEAERVRTLRNLFQKAGCAQVFDQEVPKEESPNLICLLPGNEEGTIVVGASLDYPPEEAKTPARWSTLALLPMLAESLSSVPHRFTLMFVAFSGHRHGMRGANWYLSQMTEAQRKPIQAMVDLDNLGKTPAVYALAQSDNTLANWLQVAAVSLQIPNPPRVDASTANLPLQNGVLAVRDEDLWANAKPFEHEHIPAITVQSATAAMLPALHRQGSLPDRVTGTGFDMDAYEDTYRLMCVYVLYLDRNLGRPLVEPGIYSGKIIDTAGVFSSSPIELSVKIGHFSTTGELNRYEQVLQKGGQDALAEALANENEKGNYRFGLNLAYGAKIVVLQNSGKSPYVLLVGTRLKQKGSTSQDYRFTAIKLTLDSKGSGDGVFYNSVKLRFTKRHELEIEDFGSKPDDIRQVQLEQPSIPRTTPATAVAAATGPADVPAATVNAPATATEPAAANTSANVAAPAAAAAHTASEGAPAPPSATGSTVASANIPPGVNSPKTSAATPEASVATFQTQAQLVQLDVSVTDSSGRPIAGLQQSDFTVLEDGQPQVIRAFETHLPNTVQAEKVAAVPKLALPPNTFTNQVAAPPEGPLSILLLDLWNTPVSDQAYARKQTIEFLKGLPAGKTIAMFVLGSRLTLVQGFSDDPATLVASAEKVMNERSLLMRTDAERQQFQGAADDIGRIATPAVNAPGAPAGALNNLQTGGSLDLGNAQARQRTNEMMEADRTAERVFTTLDALSALARSVSSYPGRKNLIWLSGSFPIRLKPSAAGQMQLNGGIFAPTTGLETAPNFPAALRVATRALATARIAVYPIDVRGIQMSGVDISVSAGASATFAGTSNPQAFGQNLNRQSAGRFEERSSMKEVAEQTGGEVLAGNDVRGSIGRAMEDGSTYYAIAYTPGRSDKSQEFRKIEVKLNRTGLKLAYRPGYFPSGGPAGEPPKAHPLIVAMQPGVPPSTVVPLTVVVLPPDATNKKTRITYTIDIRGMDFADTPEHRKRAVIDCIAVAFTKQGAPVGQISNTMDATLPMSDYDSALRSGLVVPQELELPPGQYDLRVGVMDHGSQKIGTLDAPLTVGAVTAAK
jgi:VWFA-related protein